MKTLRFVLLFLLLFAVLATAAFADDQATFNPSAMAVTATDADTITVTLSDSNAEVLQQLTPDIAIPCDFANAKVTGPNNVEIPCTMETLNGIPVCRFRAAKAGTYVITRVTTDSGSNSGSGSSSYSSSAGSGSSAGKTVKNADGSVTTIKTDPDTGAITTTTVAADGSTAIVQTDAEGNVTAAEASVSEAAAAAASESGTAVTLPLEFPATAAEQAVTLSVKLPETTDGVKIEFPVANVGPGSVIVIVHPDGAEEIVKNTQLTETGLVLTLNESCTVRIVDNTQTFTDMAADDWGSDAVSFVTAREIFVGTGEETFSPDVPMSRGMLMTVLARIDGTDAYGEDWMEKGVAWAVEQGVSDGSVPEDPITREQLVVMLWRYSGSPAPAGDLSDHPDGDKVSDWAAAAMAWAVENGVMHGDEKGNLNPQGLANRRQVAQFLMNYINQAQ